MGRNINLFAKCISKCQFAAETIGKISGKSTGINHVLWPANV